MLRKIILVPLLLAGCASAPAPVSYDIDLDCAEMVLQGSNQPNTRIYSCRNPVARITCKEDTVQLLDKLVLCSTHDGKTVRIKWEVLGK